MYDAYHDIKNILRNPQGAEHVYTVVGYICETDTFTDRPLPEVRPGDALSFEKCRCLRLQCMTIDL
jgi:diaminopimelate decarboxylase